MRSFRGLSHAIFVVVVMALGVLRLDFRAFAQIEPLSATPPLIEEVSRLVSKHFYDREAVERVWAQARAAHTAALPPDATSKDVAAALDAMLDDLGASHTEHYVPGELAYYELLDVFARDEFAPRLRKLFSKGQVAYTGIAMVLSQHGIVRVRFPVEDIGEDRIELTCWHELYPDRVQTVPPGLAAKRKRDHRPARCLVEPHGASSGLNSTLSGGPYLRLCRARRQKQTGQQDGSDGEQHLFQRVSPVVV
jgi:hypothetical protein